MVPHAQVQLSGIKVPTRRAVDEARMLVGLRLDLLDFHGLLLAFISALDVEKY